MDELEALKASIIKQWGEIPAEIANEIAALEMKLNPPTDAAVPGPEAA